MTVVVQSPKSFTVPVELSRLNRFWHKLTRKAVPTMELPHFHTFELDDSHDVASVELLFDRLNIQDYELVSLVVDGYDFTVEMLKHVKFLSDVYVFFNALVTDSYSADIICAFLMNEDVADVDSWPDRVYFSGTDHEDVVNQWTDVFHTVYQPHYSDYASYAVSYERTDSIPSFVEVDWEETLNKIAQENDSYVVEFENMVYYFSNH